jgi:hypothetical protein
MSSAADVPDSHLLYDAARRRVGWTVEQLWVRYLALGGTQVVFDLDGYLSGLIPLPSGQQDVLAYALNERLADLGDPGRVPYQAVLPTSDRLAAVFDELLDPD